MVSITDSEGLFDVLKGGKLPRVMQTTQCKYRPSMVGTRGFCPRRWAIVVAVIFFQIVKASFRLPNPTEVSICLCISAQGA